MDNLSERRAETEKLLEGLGNTAEEVAKSLRARNYTGKRSSRCFCPLARFLQQNGYARAVVYTEDYYLSDSPLSCGLLPHGALAFREGFDDGKFPDLEG